jgi:hypothetical protein
MRAMRRALSLIALIALAALGLGACGGDDISQAELERERADAAQNARQEAEIKALKQELGSDADGASESGSTVSAPPQRPTPGQIPGDARYCGSAYGDGSASCPFVENVSADYYASGESSSFTSYSPTTELTYTVTCNGTDPAVCTAGNAAVIYIP